MKKGAKIAISIISALVLAIGVFAIVWFCGKDYEHFYAKAKEEFAVPGLEEGFTPQGLTYYEDKDNFLVTGYMKDGSASRVYVVGSENKYFTLKHNNQDYVGHAGGVATYKEYGYIVGDKKLYVFNIEDALDLENGKSINVLAVFDAPNGADFINITEGHVYIGEFYHETKYPTSAKHHITTSNGMNYAVTYVYDIKNDKADEYYFDITAPEFAISTTEKVQGMCIAPTGEVVLSTSWSLADSNIFIYKKLADLPTQNFEFSNTKTIQMYVLDSSCLLETFVLPSMSEEVAISDGKVYVIFENACAKYKLVTRHKNTSAYSFDVADIIEE